MGKRIIEALLRNAGYSDRKIADDLGLPDHKRVGRVRRTMIERGALPHLGSRIGRDGKNYPPGHPAIEPTKSPLPSRDGRMETGAAKRRGSTDRSGRLMAERSLMDIVGGLENITSRKETIPWNYLRIRNLWMEANRAFKELEKELAVEIFGYYATPPEAVDYLMDREDFVGDIWEPCSGDGSISRVLESREHIVHSSDLRDDESIYGRRAVNVFDITRMANAVTNPPFRDALSIAEHLTRIAEGKVAMLLRNDFIGSQVRRPFLERHPPARQYPLPKRPAFLIGGDMRRRQSARWDCSWFVWVRGHTSCTEVHY